MLVHLGPCRVSTGAQDGVFSYILSDALPVADPVTQPDADSVPVLDTDSIADRERDRDSVSDPV